MNIVEYLISAGADVSFNTSDGDTVLHIASAAGHQQIVKILIREGSDVNRTNNLGNTPLQEAVGRSRVEVVKTLVSLRLGSHNVLFQLLGARDRTSIYQVISLQEEIYDIAQIHLILCGPLCR